MENRLNRVPWTAVAGEILTVASFGILGLFFALDEWVTWPALLGPWHFAIIVVSALALAIALGRRQSSSLKIAIVLAGYVGLPSLLSLLQAFQGFSVGVAIVWGLGLLGQLVVILSCLTQLRPADEFAIQDCAMPQNEIDDAESKTDIVDAIQCIEKRRTK